jgi:hypothetical protein
MKFYCFFEIGEEPEKIKKTRKLRDFLLFSGLQLFSLIMQNNNILISLKYILFYGKRQQINQ